MKNVLVMGAAGFIGSYLAERLHQRVNVIGYDRIAKKRTFSVLQGEYVTEDGFFELLDKHRIDTVYHLISTTIPKEDTSDIAKEVSDNVLPTLRLLEAMRRRGNVRLVFVSSGGTVYGEWEGHAHLTTDHLEPICGYGMQKLVIEQYLQFYNRRYGMDCRIARLSNPYGVPPSRPRGQGVIPILMGRLISGEPISLFGDTLRDYIHIDDAVEALARFGSYEGTEKIINIGSGAPVLLSDLVKMIEQTANRSFRAISHEPIRACDVRESVLDISQTKELLDWSPAISLDDGIKRTWNELNNGRH